MKLNAVILTFALMPFWGCSNSEIPNATPPQSKSHYVLLVNSTSGLGDHGFQDNIYAGITNKRKTLGFDLETASPCDSSDAEESIQKFFDERDSTGYDKRLLILSAGSYASFIKTHKNWTEDENNKILVLDYNNSDSLNVHTRYISLYGVSFWAGISVASSGSKKIRIVAANPKSFAINEAINGFITGAKGAGVNVDSKEDVSYIAENEDEGFSDLFIYFDIKNIETSLYDFIFPVMGGSNENLFRYMRQFADSVSIKTCGMDTDQQYLSEQIQFSIIKRMDLIVGKFLEDWINENTLEQNSVESLSSGYADIVVSKNHEYMQKYFDDFRSRAIDAEGKYMESQR